MSECRVMTLRPCQLMCAVCSLGEDDSRATDPGSREILEAVRRTPDIPVTLKCHVGEVFAYGDSGTPDDAPEGQEFVDSRDLEILCKLNLFPGATLPARLLFHRLLDAIEETAGISRRRLHISSVMIWRRKRSSAEFRWPLNVAVPCWRTCA